VILEAFLFRLESVLLWTKRCCPSEKELPSDWKAFPFEREGNYLWTEGRFLSDWKLLPFGFEGVSLLI